MKSISPLKTDGMTIDGTGYFACHQESHRVLYAKTPWCRMACIVAVPILSLIAIATGLFRNAPGLVIVGIAAFVATMWVIGPRKKKEAAL